MCEQVCIFLLKDLASQIKAAVISILIQHLQCGQSGMLIVLGRGQERSFNFCLIIVCISLGQPASAFKKRSAPRLIFFPHLWEATVLSY